MSEEATLKPCPFCGGRAILDACLTEAVVVCGGCGTLGPSACTQKEAEDAWNGRCEAVMPIAEFYAKHNRLISLVQNVAGAENATLVVCLERKQHPMVGVYQYQIHGVDPELNACITDLLAYCMTWLDDTKGIKV